MKCYCKFNHLVHNIIIMAFKKTKVKKADKKIEKKIEKKVEEVVEKKEGKGSAAIAQKLNDLMR